MLVCFDRWTAYELKKVIVMLRHPDFDAKDVDPAILQMHSASEG
jgi:hypothetical protein